MLKSEQITKENVIDAVSHLTSLYIGPKPRKFTESDIAVITDGYLNERRVKSYREGACEPPLHVWLQMAEIINTPHYVNELLNLIGYTGAYKIDRTPEDSCPHRMLSQIASRLNMMAEHNSDGIIDHQEKAEQKKELKSLVYELTQYCENL